MQCPVCHHVQELGFECEVCGKDLAALGRLGAPPLAIQPLDGLEPTRGANAHLASVMPLSGLEPTLYEAVEGAGLAEPGIRAELESVSEVPVVPMADLESHRTADQGRSAAPLEGPITCRYCRHVQGDGVLCERCGMRLPKRMRAAADDARRRADEPQWGRCPACGAVGKVGARCGECGVELP